MDRTWPVGTAVVVPLLLALFGGCLQSMRGIASPPGTLPPLDPPRILTLNEAVHYALENNLELRARRQQHGIAAAGLVIAQTYPHNPVTQSTVFGISGPESAGITNRVANQHKVILDVEVRGQGRYRTQAAEANLTRTDWEIAAQEVALVINLIRAFDGVVYRQEKLRVTEEFLRLNQQALDQARRLVEAGVLRPSDLLLIQTEMEDIRSQVGLGRTTLVTAKRDLYRALGIAEWYAEPQGSLQRVAPSLAVDQLLETALPRRPDLQSRKAAVEEADAQIRLAVADRFGNPSVGPVYEYNETRVNFIGVQFGVPLPLFNCRQGEILQKHAQRDLAVLEVQRVELEIRQEVQAAVARVTEAKAWVESYRSSILPNLRKTLEDMERLFQQGQPGIDALRVLDVRRKLLRAQDGYLDALREHTQALADLAAAVGDPGVAMEPCPPETQVPEGNK